MKIRDYAIAADGGTQIVSLETDEGKRLSIGMNGRMDSPDSGKQLFIGSSTDNPDTKWLPIGSTDEKQVIGLLQQWLDQTQGFLRREALMDADQSSLKGQDRLDRLGLEFVLAVLNRDLG